MHAIIFASNYELLLTEIWKTTSSLSSAAWLTDVNTGKISAKAGEINNVIEICRCLSISNQSVIIKLNCCNY